MKIFAASTSNRKPGFESLEADVNAWLADRPNIVIERTTDVSQPNAAWSHLAIAVWYSEN